MTEEPREIEVERDWTFTWAPYVWMMGVSGDVEVRRREAEFDASFGDVLDSLDFSYQVYFEAVRDKWGGFGDIIYADLGAEDDRAFIDVDVDSKMAFVEAALFRRIHLGRLPEGNRLHAVDLFVGARWNYLDIELDAESFVLRINDHVSGSRNFFDLMVGVRAGLALSDKWALNLRTYFAGFGIGSSSELTWSASAMFGYSLNNRYTLYGGYRYRDIELEPESRRDVNVDMTLSGPIIGLALRF